MELDEVADELYEVAPEEFIAVRTARQDEAKADGDKSLAKQIGSLPKPSTAAWVCNLLVRAHREEIEGLVELGNLLRDAQESLAGDQLRALNTQRGQLLNALTRQASALARERGYRVGTSIAGQVEETLRAAMADPEAGQALLSGRLTSPMSYSGLGTASARPDLRLVPPPTRENRPAATAAPAKAPSKAAPRTPSTKERGETAAERRERERAERETAAEEKRLRELARARELADEAAAAAAEARTAADEQRRQTEELAVEHADLQARVEELADRLADAERAAGEAAAALKRAQRRSTAAERDAAEAAEARDRTQAAVDHLVEQAPG